MTTDDLIAHVEHLRATPIDRWTTRDRILYEAGRLMAAKGYHGASTREISTAVGIRQPSLFNHFPTKRDMLVELMRYEMSVPTDRARHIAAEAAPAADRLMRYMHWDFDWYARMPLDLRGIKEELLDEPGLGRFKDDLAAWKRAIERIVRDGITAGEFHEVNPAVVSTMLSSISWEIVRTSGLGRSRSASGTLRRGAAETILRGLLVRID